MNAIFSNGTYNLKRKVRLIVLGALRPVDNNTGSDQKNPINPAAILEKWPVLKFLWLLFFRIFPKGVDPFYTGHHLKSHPMDIIYLIIYKILYLFDVYLM